MNKELIFHTIFHLPKLITSIPPLNSAHCVIIHSIINEYTHSYTYKSIIERERGILNTSIDRDDACTHDDFSTNFNRRRRVGSVPTPRVCCKCQPQQQPRGAKQRVGMESRGSSLHRRKWLRLLVMTFCGRCGLLWGPVLRQLSLRMQPESIARYGSNKCT